MAGRGEFETKAVIRLIDEMTGPMKQLANEVNGLNKSLGREMAAAQQQAAEAAAGHWQHFASVLKDSLKAAAVSAAMHFKQAADESFRYALETERKLAQFRAITPNVNPVTGEISAMTDAQFKAEQRAANTNPAIVSPAEYAEGLVAASRTGTLSAEMRRQQVESAKFYRLESGTSEEQAIEEIQQHIAMTGERRDKNGNVIGINSPEWSPAQEKDLEAAVTGRLGLLAKAGNESMAQVFEAMRLIGPIATNLHVPLETLYVQAAQLANLGFKGMEGGTALRALYGRAVSPTREGRFQETIHGIAREDYTDINRSMADPTNWVKGIEGQVGKLSAAAEKKMHDLAERFKNDSSFGVTDFQNAFVDAMLDKHIQGVNNRIKAANIVQQIMSSMFGGIDIDKLITKLREGATDKATGVVNGPALMAEFNAIVGLKQGGRNVSLNPEDINRAGSTANILARALGIVPNPTNDPTIAKNNRERADQAGIKFADEGIHEYDKDYAKQFDYAVNALEGVGKALVDELGPAIVEISGKVQAFAKWFDGLDEAKKTMAAWGAAGTVGAITIALPGMLFALARSALGASGALQRIAEMGVIGAGPRIGAAAAAGGKSTALAVGEDVAAAEAAGRAGRGLGLRNAGAVGGAFLMIDIFQDWLHDRIDNIAVPKDQFPEIGNGRSPWHGLAEMTGLVNPFSFRDPGSPGESSLQVGNAPVGSKLKAWWRNLTHGTYDMPQDPGGHVNLGQDSTPDGGWSIPEVEVPEIPKSLPVSGGLWAPQKVEVAGQAEVRSNMEVRITGLDVLAGEITRNVENNSTVNLGNANSGAFQGVPYKPLMPPAPPSR